jgi:Brp/Blh family beta-carotene 15,15'-monooxygenase
VALSDAGAGPAGERTDRATVDPALQSAVRALAVRPLWAVFAAVSVPFLLGASIPRWAQYVPLVASGVAFGMPHGAVDHLVPARIAGGSRVRSAVGVGVLYLVVGGGYLLSWFVAPLPAAVAFVLVTWFHWGQGDVYLLAVATGGRYPRSVGHRGLTVLVRGAMPMAVPLLAFPGEYRRVVADLVGLFGGDVAGIEFAFAPGTRLAVGGVVATLVAATLLRGGLARTGSGWERRLDRGFRTDAAEVALLGAYFLLVPPVLAVGLYFCLWHSVRHVVRLLAVDEAGARALRERRVGRSLAQFGRDAAPLTVVALSFLALAYPLVPRAPGGLGEGVALYLVLIAALTLPHVVVVTWMDHRQGVWAGGGTPPNAG